MASTYKITPPFIGAIKSLFKKRTTRVDSIQPITLVLKSEFYEIIFSDGTKFIGIERTIKDAIDQYCENSTYKTTIHASS